MKLDIEPVFEKKITIAELVPGDCFTFTIDNFNLDYYIKTNKIESNMIMTVKLFNGNTCLMGKRIVVTPVKVKIVRG